MKKYFILIFLVINNYFVVSGQGSRIINYSVENGLINNTVYYSMQDSKGFMWFCTESGVSRFDGKNWDKLTLENGLVDNENFKCFEDTKNRIWFLSTNGKFCYYFNGKIYSVPISKSLGNLEVGMLYDCIEDKKSKKVYFQSNLRKLFYYDEINREIKFVCENSFILCLYKNDTYTFLNDGRLMDLTAISLSKNRQIESIIPSKGQYKENYYINKSLPVVGKNNRIFYLTNLGIYQINQGKISSYVALKDFPNLKAIVLNYKSNNDLYFGGAGGIYKIKNAFTSKKAKPILYLKDIEANNIVFDKNGNLWVSTHNKGVFFYPKNYTNSKNIELFIQNETMETYCVSKNSSKTIQIGLNRNTLAEIDKSNKISYKKLSNFADLKFNRIKSIASRKGTTFYISDNFFLVNKSNNKNPIFNYSNYYYTLKSYCFDNQGDVWLVSTNFIQKYDVKKNSISDSIYLPRRASSIACDSKNQLYIGTKQGLFKRVKENTPTPLNFNIPLFEVGINHLIFENNRLWISTHGNGIIILKNDHVYKKLKTNNGLISNVCYRLIDDHDGHIFVCTSLGLSIINTKNFTITNLTISDGLISNDIKDVFIDDEGKVYIATNKGISILSWQQIQKTVLPPSPYLRKIQVNDSIFNCNQKSFEFLYEPGILSFQFAAITFYTPGLTTYRYRIKGEKKWQSNTSGNISFYTLSPGNYTIELQAKQYKSIWSKPIVTSFSILPLWYQTTFFKTFTSLSIILLLTVLIYWRINLIRQRDKAKHLIEIRMNELERKTLAAQMNPHFIFNSLNTLQQLVLDEETETALNYLNDFAVLVRQILTNSRKPAISINEEIAFLKNYLLVEKVRYNESFDFEITIQEGIDELITIPPMLLQPIVENAIKYGVSTASLNFPKISISIWQESHFLNFEITDNGAGYEKVKTLQTKNQLTKSNALEILTERLALISVHKNKGSITLTSFDESDKQGTIVLLKIPI